MTRTKAPARLVMDEDARSYGWHLDRRIPLALILTILLQCGLILWWGSGVTHDIVQLKQDVGSLKSEAKATAAAMVDLATVKNDIGHMSKAQERLQQSVDRLVEKTGQRGATTYVPVRPKLTTGAQ